MNTLPIVLAVIAYLTMAMTVKAYYKLNRWDELMDEEPYIIGLFWPVYISFILIAWPLSNASGLIERQMIRARQAKEKVKEQAKLRIETRIDPEYQEAEQEVEHFLAKEKERHHPL